MAAEKTKAIILRVIPYRESSCILHLFTEKHGLVHGIAKGIKKQQKTKENFFIERGALLELVIYTKVHRDLNTLSSIAVTDYFPAIRSNLIKTALRDAAFEAILTSITESDIHPELFELFLKFLHHIHQSPISECHPFALWLFYHRFSQLMGFGLDISVCISCSTPLKNKAFLIINKGGFECDVCCKNKMEYNCVPVHILSYLEKGIPKPQQLREILTPKMSKNITGQLADYCRYHFNIQTEYKSLIFLNDMSEW